VSIKIPKSTSETYVDALCQAADEIKLRAEEFIGDINGQQSITIAINLNSHEIVTIDVYKTFISGYKQHTIHKQTTKKEYEADRKKEGR
jgi:hypothetical protein